MAARVKTDKSGRVEKFVTPDGKRNVEDRDKEADSFSAAELMQSIAYRGQRFADEIERGDFQQLLGSANVVVKQAHRLLSVMGGSAPG